MGNRRKVDDSPTEYTWVTVGVLNGARCQFQIEYSCCGVNSIEDFVDLSEVDQLGLREPSTIPTQ